LLNTKYLRDLSV